MDRRAVARLLSLCGGLLIGGVLAFLSGQAHATTLIFNNEGNIIGSFAGRIPSLTISGTGFSAGAAGGVNYTQNALVRVGSGAVPVNVPLTVSQGVSAATVRGLAVGALRGSVQGMVVGAAVKAAINAAGYECDLTGCYQSGGTSTQTVQATTENATATQTPQALRYGFKMNNKWYETLLQAGQAQVGYGSLIGCTGNGYSTQGVCTFTQPWNGYQLTSLYVQSCGVSGAAETTTNCAKVYTCPEGWVNNYNGTCQRLVCPAGYERDGTTCSMLVNNPRILVQDGVVLNNSGIVLSPDDQAAIVQQAMNLGLNIPADPPVVSGPASVTSDPVVSTKNNPVTTVVNGVPQTVNNVTTTTTTTTVNNTYNNNTVQSSVVNNTTTTGPDGQTTQQTSDPVKDPEPDPVVTDSDLPEVPKLYTRKYEDGLTGVWDSKIAEIKSSPLFSLPQVFAPNIAGGTCPSWTFNANIGPGMMLGSGTIAPPCWVWDFIKAVVVICSLMLARALVFGG